MFPILKVWTRLRTLLIPIIQSEYKHAFFNYAFTIIPYIQIKKRFLWDRKSIFQGWLVVELLLLEKNMSIVTTLNTIFVKTSCKEQEKGLIQTKYYKEVVFDKRSKGCHNFCHFV